MPSDRKQSTYDKEYYRMVDGKDKKLFQLSASMLTKSIEMDRQYSSSNGSSWNKKSDDKKK